MRRLRTGRRAYRTADLIECWPPGSRFDLTTGSPP